MAKRSRRFIEEHSQSAFATETRIPADRQTEVNYLFRHAHCAGKLTPLLDREGGPVITTVPDED